MKENIFIRFGNWIARQSLKDRVTALETQNIALREQLAASVQVIQAADKTAKELKDRVTRLELHTGFKHAIDPKQNIELWNSLSR